MDKEKARRGGLMFGLAVVAAILAGGLVIRRALRGSRLSRATRSLGVVGSYRRANHQRTVELLRRVQALTDEIEASPESIARRSAA